MTRRWVALLLAAAAAPAAAGDSGPVLSLRGGYARPFGDLSRDAGPLDGFVASKLPLWIEVGYRFGGHVLGELYFEGAPARRKAPCPPGWSCSASDVRFGLAVQLHAAPAAWADPWLAAGLGVEILGTPAQVVGPDGSLTMADAIWSGLEVPLEAGVDVRVTRHFSLGPFAATSLAQFTSVSTRPASGTTVANAIDRRATHGWIELGAKATLRL